MRSAILLFALALLSVSPLSGQVERGDPIPLSQHARVKQAVAWASIDLEYRRPVARGRELFGSLIPWDEAWTPAADSAVVFTTSAPLTVAGEPLAAGSYSLWLIPREAGPWTVIFSRNARVFHGPYPGPRRDALRVEVEPKRGEHVESVLFLFPWAEGPETELHFRWGETLLPIPITVR
ncbi:MAG: DUF2911 domain-containing protein [Longimicrobiales bacterium]|nr:DUF2911 domain-containing protein [Longimicrobiales bacterium]